MIYKIPNLPSHNFIV